MIETFQVILLVVAGILGTLISIGLGWSESTEPFDAKKFVSSIIRGSIGIVVYILGTYASVSTINVWDYIEVAVFAAGFDVLIKRGQGTISS